MTALLIACLLLFAITGGFLLVFTGPATVTVNRWDRFINVSVLMSLFMGAAGTPQWTSWTFLGLAIAALLYSRFFGK